jgi:riboflavin kinase/FMN adenylyltransferase
MQVARSLDEIAYDGNTVVTVGTFDGIHLGHQKIINELIARSKSRNGRSVLITFDPHPREVVGRGPTKLLTTIDERLHLLSQNQIDIIFIINFTFEFSRLPYDEFYKDYIYDKIGISEVIVGSDHMFGRDREANINQLIALGKRSGFVVDSIPPVTVDGVVVSSSRIRDIIMRGDVKLAEKYLGRQYSLKGKVVNGDGRGKSIGFPTANVQPLSYNKLIPAEGVYFVSVNLEEQKYYGMLNIGSRPTFTADTQKIIEVHLFDFKKNIYDEMLTVKFHRRIRSEIKFESKEELVTQLMKDKQECKIYVSELNNLNK